ncbi:DNA cytosine methyltransferase [Ewingella sp. AOP8-B2-18]
MAAYYNEFDPYAAQWLRNLIKAGHIAPGIVDERSIVDVSPEDLKGFTQCHFFAGVGVWSLALRKAGWPDDKPVWTGSCPCQPFSAAGKQLGQLDERHLAPVWLKLIKEHQPATLFGEQVAAAIGKHWLDDLFTELENQGYACGAAVLPACSVGAPHKRDRVWFGAQLLEHSRSVGRKEGWSGNNEQHDREQSSAAGENGVLANTNLQCESSAGDSAGASNIGGVKQVSKLADTERQQCEKRLSGLAKSNGKESCGAAIEPTGFCLLGGLANDDGTRSEAGVSESKQRQEGVAGKFNNRGGEFSGISGASATPSGSKNNFIWRDADWLLCRDGKWRPVEPGTFPLANGITNRVGRLRAYGNAIVPQAATEFIAAFDEALG